MSVHRIRIHADRGGDPVAVDLVLPSGVAVGELLPAILDLVGERTAPGASARGWRLDRPSGGALAEALSLSDNGVHDGELLVLAPEHEPHLGAIRLEPCRGVAETRLPNRVAGGSLIGTAGVLAAVPAAVTLVWTGVSAPTPANLIVAAVGACAAAITAITTGHPTVAAAAVALAAAAGFLAVPSGPAAPNFLLAAAAACAVSLLVLRLSGRPSSGLIGAASFSALIGVVTVITLPVAVVGTALSVTSLGLLALAPRIAVVTAGLGPERWSDEMDAHAAAGHASLTGLVAGCASGAAAGAVLVGLGYDAPIRGADAFAMLVGLVLLLRARTYVDQSRQRSLIAAGFIGVTASFGCFVAAHPEHAGLAGGIAIAVALVAGRRPRIGDGLSRTADRLEYVALAAVVPVALWVGGAYALVGEVRLP